MMVLKVCVVLSLSWWWCMVTGTLFHEDSRVLLMPNRPANYFGYSVLLRNSTPPRLVVGAPIAQSTHAVHAGLGDTGAVYSCSLDLTGNPQNITCTSMEFDTEGNSVNTNGRGISVHHYKDEMWLGAALADVNNGSLVMCAPRWANQVESQRASHRLVNGLCYITSGTRAGLLVPLADMAHQAYLPSGPGYDKGMVLNYFAYGQAGFSARVSPDQRWLLLGAPGLLQWTGGIAKYSITHRVERGDDYFGKQPIHNPFFTKQLQSDSYFGYSVDAGVFEIGGETLGVGGAPRGNGGLGQVLIFILKGGGESTALRIKAELSGSQLGSYFGGTLLVVDVNADGRADLLVGAPLYADRNLEKMPYDQGVVYVYLNRPKASGFTMELVDTLTGSGASGARFGSALADLGDVDDAESTRYPEIAIGAPWESEGRGAVYIYKSGSTGVGPTHVQKISPEFMGFGFSIARSLDVDGNGCNDLIVGALNSNQVILYRCTRTIHVSSEIKVPSAFDLPENSTDFTAEFCVIAAETKQQSASDIGPVSIGVVVTVSMDVGAGGRATLTGDREYTEPQVEPGRTYCKQRRVDINPSADLSRPLTLKMYLRVAPGNPPKGHALGPGVRLGTTSRQNASLDVQLTRDCGEDLICQPSLILHLTSLSSSPYIPGSTERLGAAVHVVNVGEPAYGACVKITLPGSPLRVPSDCRLDGMELTCELQRPFYRRAEADWTLEIDDTSTMMEEYDLVLKARVYESCIDANGKAHTKEDLVIRVVPQANLTVVGYSPSNMTISREKFKEGGDYDFGHSFAVTNFGPSNLPALEVEFSLPPEVSLLEEVPECVRAPNSTAHLLSCSWNLPAYRQHTALLLLRLNLHERGYLLEQGAVNITTNVYIKYDNITVEVTSCISLEESPPLWPIIVGVLLGLLLIAIITLALYKAGFFGRAQRERLDRLKKELASKVHAPGSMEDILINQSDLELEHEQNSREPSPLSDLYAVVQ